MTPLTMPLTQNRFREAVKLSDKPQANERIKGFARCLNDCGLQYPSGDTIWKPQYMSADFYGMITHPLTRVCMAAQVPAPMILSAGKRSLYDFYYNWDAVTLNVMNTVRQVITDRLDRRKTM